MKLILKVLICSGTFRFCSSSSGWPVPGAMHKQIQCEFERCAQEINTALEFVVSLSHGALVNVNILSNLPHSQNLHCEIPEWRI